MYYESSPSPSSSSSSASSSSASFPISLHRSYRWYHRIVVSLADGKRFCTLHLLLHDNM